MSPDGTEPARPHGSLIPASPFRRLLLALAATVVWAALGGGAWGQGFSDPRLFGVPAGRFGFFFAVPIGFAGIACAVALGRIRRHHSKRWLRPWFIAAATAPPLLLAGLPMLSGAIASRYLWGSHYADVALLAATRLMSLAAGAVWLVFEFLAAERQHEQELYADQRSSDRASLIMRRAAALLGVVALVALVQGLSVSVPESLGTGGCSPAKTR